MELLLPVGGLKQLIAAVENGADAVYLGGQSFNARQYADNFDDDVLKESIEYAHVRGVNVYLTMNTLISDGELQQAINEVCKAYVAGIDALIVQDMGFAHKVKAYIPDLHIHISTQGTVYNFEGVQILEDLGYDRVILARELTIQGISNITQCADMEIEVFVHGALCIGYSGQCLLSSMIGGRSGNRGRCAQPCRLPYQIIDSEGNIATDKSYLMSPKDLSAVNLLPKLIKAGVVSLKIEGRMKSAEYVAAVAKIYRKYLDLAIANDKEKIGKSDYKTLLQVFNRNGFSSGYLENKKGFQLISKESPKHWGVLTGEVVSYDKRNNLITAKLYEPLSMGDGVEIRNKHLPGNIITYMEASKKQIHEAQAFQTVTIGEIRGRVFKGDKIYKITDKVLNKSLQQSFSGNKPIKKISVTGAFTAKKGQLVTLAISDDDGNKNTVHSTKKAEEAVKRALTNEDVLKQLNKTGSTPFHFKACRINMEENISIPLSEINALRRDALEGLTKMRKEKYKYRQLPIIKIDFNKDQRKISNPKISIFIWSKNQLDAVIQQEVGRIYVPLREWMQDEFRECVRNLKKDNTEIMVWLPPITKGYYDQWLRNNNQQEKFKGLKGILIGNLSHIKILNKVNLPFYGDYSLNVYNSHTIEFFKQLGLTGITLSNELTLQQIKDIKSVSMDVETVVYGRLPLMISEHCPVGSELGKKANSCGLCHKPYFLSDRKDKKFPLLLDDTECRSTILNADKLWVPDLIQPLGDAGVSTLRLYFHDEASQEITRRIQACKEALNQKPLNFKRGEGYTKGHYFRGAE